MRRCLLAGGTKLPRAGSADHRRMLHVPGAILELQREFGVTFRRNELAELTEEEVVRRVAADFARAAPA